MSDMKRGLKKGLQTLSCADWSISIYQRKDKIQRQQFSVNHWKAAFCEQRFFAILFIFVLRVSSFLHWVCKVILYCTCVSLTVCGISELKSELISS